MDPLLLDVPERLETERLVLRCPRPGDGPAVNLAVCDSLEGLRPWMPWAKAAPSIEDSEAYCRRMHAKFLLREDLVLLILERGSEGAAVRCSAVGLHRIDWIALLRVGYLRRKGGRPRIVSEAVGGCALAGPPRRAPSRDPHGRRQRAEPESCGACWLHVRGLVALECAGARWFSAQHARLRPSSRPGRTRLKRHGSPVRNGRPHR